jgi:hypothetical protein
MDVSKNNFAFTFKVKENQARIQHENIFYLLHRYILLGLFFDPEDGSGI